MNMMVIYYYNLYNTKHINLNIKYLNIILVVKIIMNFQYQMSSLTLKNEKLFILKKK
jgi:hypothetical protein